jgi:hypothetical protein
MRSMPVHIRRCVECPKCFTRYLIGFSPYRNGAYLVPTAPGTSEEYALYCSCRRPSASSQWKWSEMKAYAVAKVAHARGYGSCHEIVTLEARQRPQAATTDEIMSQRKFRGRKIS